MILLIFFILIIIKILIIIILYLKFLSSKALKNQEIFVVLGSHYKILQLYKNIAGYRKYLMESLDTDQ